MIRFASPGGVLPSIASVLPLVHSIVSSLLYRDPGIEQLDGMLKSLMRGPLMEHAGNRCDDNN